MKVTVDVSDIRAIVIITYYTYLSPHHYKSTEGCYRSATIIQMQSPSSPASRHNYIPAGKLTKTCVVVCKRSRERANCFLYFFET